MDLETLIPKVGVVTDIRIDTPDVKDVPRRRTRRKQAVRAYAGSVRDAVDSGCRRGDVLDHFVADKQRIHGIQHQEVRLSDKLASHDGAWPADHRPRSVRKCVPG